MKPQVDRVVTQAKAARAMLRPVLQSRLQLRTKVGIYKTYIRSRLTYAAPAWYALCSASQRRRLQVQQNAALRLCTNAGRYVRNDVIARDLKVPSVEQFVVRLTRAMFSRADIGREAHLRDLAPLHARPPDATRALPRDPAAGKQPASGWPAGRPVNERRWGGIPQQYARVKSVSSGPVPSGPFP
ncbi:uncharacterized protein LOC131847292 [Achroia grisella]|uniref:uncharacterized protein LOC131847292 n=1 Tax=Achroia grisella TaxID=688607 RepID=UPI0027D291CC|nr:uncharacterized protein LOC131847292 [Achroia grisella]